MSRREGEGERGAAGAAEERGGPGLGVWRAEAQRLDASARRAVTARRAELWLARSCAECRETRCPRQ
jgi:hypothetical protein